jgi:hypothetical protein
MGSVITTRERKNEVRQIIREAGLDWFRCEPGFRFLDSDGAECIVIGWGGYRSAEALGSLQLYANEKAGTPRMGEALFSLEMHSATLVGAYLYKGEQHLCSIPDMEDLDKCQPFVAAEVAAISKHL